MGSCLLFPVSSKMPELRDLSLVNFLHFANIIQIKLKCILSITYNYFTKLM